MSKLEVPKDLSIPKFLKRKETAEARAKREAIIAEDKNPKIELATGKTGRDWLQPKGMSDEEWAKRKERYQEEAKAKAKERKAEKGERIPKRPSRDGLLPVADIVKDLGLDAKEARVILRAIKYPKPPHGWAFKPGKDADAVHEAIKKGMESSTKSATPKKAKAKKLKIPPPEETTWSLDKKDKKKWRKAVKKRDKDEPEEPEETKPHAVSDAAKARMKKGKKK